MAQALATNEWDTRAWIGPPLVAAIIVALVSRKTWTRILAAEPDAKPHFKRRHRNLLITAAVLLAVFFLIAAATGTAIGNERATMISFNGDVNHEVAAARRIGDARKTAEATIIAQIQMYKVIEPDVQDYESILRRLVTETREYDVKFPNQHQQTAENMTIFDKELRRSQLLRQEITLAREIEVADPSEQLSIWRTRMLPLLNAEDALDSSK